MNTWDDPLVDSYDMVAYLSAAEVAQGRPWEWLGERNIRKCMLTQKQFIYWKAYYESKGYKVRYAQSTFGEGVYS